MASADVWMPMASPFLRMRAPAVPGPAASLPAPRRATTWQGAATEDHPVTEELARIKKYMGNLKALGQGAAEEQARLKVGFACLGC